MIDKETAKQMVLKQLNPIWEEGRYKYLINDSATIELKNAWVFFYNSRKFFETGNPKWMLGGNAPIIVEKETGKQHVTGTAYSIEHYVENFEIYGTPHPEREQQQNEE